MGNIKDVLMDRKPRKGAVRCSRCQELTTAPRYLDGDIPVCRECLEDLVFDAKFDQFEEERDEAEVERAKKFEEKLGIKNGI